MPIPTRARTSALGGYVTGHGKAWHSKHVSSRGYGEERYGEKEPSMPVEYGMHSSSDVYVDSGRR